MTSRPEPHPAWCGSGGCADPAHTWRIGCVCGDGGLATLVLSQPGDVPVLSVVTDAGPVLVVPVGELVAFATFLADAVSIARDGEWPEYIL